MQLTSDILMEMVWSDSQLNNQMMELTIEEFRSLISLNGFQELLKPSITHLSHQRLLDWLHCKDCLMLRSSFIIAMEKLHTLMRIKSIVISRMKPNKQYPKV